MIYKLNFYVDSDNLKVLQDALSSYQNGKNRTAYEILSIIAVQKQEQDYGKEKDNEI